MIKLLLSIIALSLLVGCTDPGDVFINVKKGDRENVVQIKNFQWKVEYGTYISRSASSNRSGWRPADPEAAEAIEKYLKALQ